MRGGGRFRIPRRPGEAVSRQREKRRVEDPRARRQATAGKRPKWTGDLRVEERWWADDPRQNKGTKRMYEWLERWD